MDNNKKFPLRWFKFSLYFRYPFKILFSLFFSYGKFKAALSEPSTFAFIIDILYVATTIALFLIAISGCLRFAKYGLKALYAVHILLIIGHLLTICAWLLVFTPINFANAILQILMSIVDLIYFYKRRHLFLHKDFFDTTK